MRVGNLRRDPTHEAPQPHKRVRTRRSRTRRKSREARPAECPAASSARIVPTSSGRLATSRTLRGGSGTGRTVKPKKQKHAHKHDVRQGKLGKMDKSEAWPRCRRSRLRYGKPARTDPETV